MSKNNIETNLELFKDLSKLTGLKDNTFRNMMYLLYHGYIHKIACKSLDSEERLKSVEIPVFGIGNLILDTSDLNNISIKSFDLTKDFIQDIQNAVKEGISPIENDITEKFIKDITNKYSELI